MKDNNEKPQHQMAAIDLIVTKGDGVALPNQKQAIHDFKEQCLEQKLSEFIPKAKLVEWLKDVKNTPWVQVDWENSTKESFVKVSDLLQAIESYS